MQMDVDYIKNNPNVAKKYMFTEETKSLRKYGDYFAWGNNTIFKEILRFEDYFLRQMLGNYKAFCDLNIENLT